jgi:hypothetical protein
MRATAASFPRQRQRSNGDAGLSRERESLHARTEKLDFELVIGDISVDDRETIWSSLGTTALRQLLWFCHLLLTTVRQRLAIADHSKIPESCQDGRPATTFINLNVAETDPTDLHQR